MSYPPTRKGPAVPGQINIHDEYEISYWTKALDVTEDELRRLVGKYGVCADDIRINRGRRAS